MPSAHGTSQPRPLGTFSAKETPRSPGTALCPCIVCSQVTQSPLPAPGCPRGSLPSPNPPGHGGVHGKGGVRVSEATGRNGVHGLSLPTKTRVSGGKRSLPCSWAAWDWSPADFHLRDSQIFQRESVPPFSPPPPGACSVLLSSQEKRTEWEEEEEEGLSQKGAPGIARVGPSLLWHEPAQRVRELPHGSR